MKKNLLVILADAWLLSGTDALAQSSSANNNYFPIAPPRYLGWANGPPTIAHLNFRVNNINQMRLQSSTGLINITLP